MCVIVLYCSSTYTHKCNAATPSVPLLRQQWPGSASGIPTPKQIQLYINTQYGNFSAVMANTSTITGSGAQCKHLHSLF